MADLKDLANKMKEASRTAQKSGAAFLRDTKGRFKIHDTTIIANTALIMLETAIDATPVDTGRAVSNWQISAEGLREAVEIEPYFPGNGGSTAIECMNAAKRVAKRDIRSWNKVADLHVVNPVDYVIYLNDGTTNRPGVFMIERAVAAGQAYVRSIKH